MLNAKNFIGNQASGFAFVAVILSSAGSGPNLRAMVL